MFYGDRKEVRVFHAKNVSEQVFVQMGTRLRNGYSKVDIDSCAVNIILFTG